MRMSITVLIFACSASLASAAPSARFSVESSERGAVVKIDGEVFAEYLTKAGTSPALWPIIGPSGKKMTRTYPLGPKDPVGTDDHPHHQSLWFTHDDINGVNFWSGNVNGGDKNGPHVAHREFVNTASNGETAKIVTRNDWMDGNQRIMDDERTLVFGQRDNGDRWIDFTITLKASEGDVTIGDTKEGTFAIRVPDTMRVEAIQGGRIVSSEGLRNDDAWGMPAEWVDYTGPVEGEPLGIAMFSHPNNFRPRPRWHVRGYGLFTANPFGQRDFPRPELADQGAYRLRQGDKLTLRYRVLFHRGTTAEADIAGAYQEFATLP
jgi:hypothetical protein